MFSQKIKEDAIQAHKNTQPTAVAGVRGHVIRYLNDLNSDDALYVLFVYTVFVNMTGVFITNKDFVKVIFLAPNKTGYGQSKLNNRTNNNNVIRISEVNKEIKNFFLRSPIFVFLFYRQRKKLVAMAVWHWLPQEATRGQTCWQYDGVISRSGHTTSACLDWLSVTPGADTPPPGLQVGVVVCAPRILNVYLGLICKHYCIYADRHFKLTPQTLINIHH